MQPDATGELPALTTPGPWEGVLDERARAALEPALPRYLAARRWFGGKARTIQRVEILDAVPVPIGERQARFALLPVAYAQGEPDIYAADREPGFARALLEAVAHGKRFEGGDGELAAWPTKAFAAQEALAALEP